MPRKDRIRSIRKLIKSRKTLKEILIFLLKFNLLAMPLYALIYVNFSFQPLQIFLTDALYEVLKLMGYDIAKSGFLLGLASGSTIATIEINFDCTGWKSLYALAALTIATPVAGRKKMRFLAFGMPALFFINFLRVLTTIAFAYSFGFQFLGIVHTLLWREGLILAVIGIWYLLLKGNI